MKISPFLKKLFNLEKKYYVDKTSIVKTREIGNRTRIWQYVIILEGAKIGKDCNICSHCFIENNVKIGDRVTIKNGVQIWNSIEIEDDVFIGPNVTFTNDLYPRSRNKNFEPIPTLIKRGASIGANSTILAGVQIGEWSMVGAGSVVTRDIPPFGLAYGIPAKLKGWVCICGKSLNINNQEIKCPHCKRSYVYSKIENRLFQREEEEEEEREEREENRGEG